MRRWLIAILIFSFLFVTIVYIALPSKIKVQQLIVVNASRASSYRCLTDSHTIQKWWKGNSKAQTPGTPVSFENEQWRYQFKPLMYNGAEVLIKNDNETLQSLLVISPLSKDSTLIEWKAEWPKTGNPFQRIQYFWQARQVNKNIGDVLQQLRAFINSPEKLYGLHIAKAKVIDTIIITTKKVFKFYPTPADYYPMIEILQQYIATTGAQATNYPMLNIKDLNVNGYGVMVGIPINKMIPGKANIELKLMIPGNILVADVIGGPNRIEAAMRDMQDYIQENGLMPPAIPFQSLVTDRKVEPDTTRWVTKLYFPVY